MVLEREFQSNRSSNPQDLIIGLVASILLHSLLLVDANNWLQVFDPESKRESQPVIIEFVEVPPSETKPPQQTKHRAAKDSTASGKVVSKPDSTAGLVSPQAPNTSSSSINSPTVKSTQPKSAQSTAVLPLSPPKSQPESGKIAAPSISQEPQPKKPAVVPNVLKSQPKPQTEIVKRLKARNPEPAIPQSQPQRQIVKQLQAKNPEPAIPQPQRDILKQLQAKNPEPAIPQPQPQRDIVKQLQAKNSEPPIPQPPIKPQTTTVAPNLPIQTQPQKPAVVPNTPKTQPQLQKPAIATTNSKPKPLNPQENQKLSPKSSTQQLTTRINPTIPKPQPSPRQGNKNPLPSKSTTEQLAARTTRQTPPQPSSTSGAASSLGGPMSLSSRNLGSNYWAASPNSNSSNPGAGGIDARREPELGPYLEQLRQQVKQQWLPGITQHSRQSVVHFVVSRSGLMSNLQLVQPSGYRAIDEAALSAVKRAAPFAPLPPGYSQDNIIIRFTFNINVYGELELGTR